MEELIRRFTDAEKFFMEGMINVFSGMIDNGVEVSEIPTIPLIQIIGFCATIFDSNTYIKTEIEQRWNPDVEPQDLYDDLYDALINANEDFFLDLADQN